LSSVSDPRNMTREASSRPLGTGSGATSKTEQDKSERWHVIPMRHSLDGAGYLSRLVEPDTDSKMDSNRPDSAGHSADLKSQAQSVETKEEERRVRSLLSLSMKGMLGNGRGKAGKMAYLRTRTTMGVNLTANSVAAKYLLLIGANTVWDVNQIQNCVEWGSFNTVFEEFFVHAMTFRFEPNNQFTTGYGTGTVNLEDCICSLAAYQHNQPAPTDSTHVWADMQNSRISKVTNTGRPWTFNWKNIEKFSKDGPTGDATTATNSQSWLNILSVAKYGGYASAATPYPSNAAAGAGQFVNGYVFGNILVSWDVSFRYRD